MVQVTTHRNWGNLSVFCPGCMGIWRTWTG